MNIFRSIILLTLITFLSPSTLFASHLSINPHDLVKCPDFSAVYYISDEEERWVFPTDKVFFSWYEDFDDVMTITCDALASYSLGGNVTYQPGTRLVKMPSVPTVYAVESGGVLRAISSESQANNLWGEDWAERVDDLSEAFFPNYEVGDVLPVNEIPEGTILVDEDEEYYWMDFDGELLELEEALEDDYGTVLPRHALSLEQIEDNLDLPPLQVNDLDFDSWSIRLLPAFEGYNFDNDDTSEEDDEEESADEDEDDEEKDDDESSADSGLADHNTYISFSSDPTDFESGTLIAEGASVPDLLVCTEDSDACDEGEMLIYFVDAEGTSDTGLALIRSTDGGETWSEREGVEIDGMTQVGSPVDPSAIQLSNGEIRLYYFGSSTTSGDPAEAPGDHVMYSAVSEDGVEFEVEDGERFALEEITDPEVILHDGTWFMYYSLGMSSGVAVSEDGLDFEDEGEIDAEVGGVPGALVIGDDIRLYGCGAGILSALSSDGIEFTLDEFVSIVSVGTSPTCDPSLDQLDDEYILVYKIDEGD